MNKQEKREKLYQDIFQAANAAGVKAATDIVPVPMIVGTAIGLSDKMDPSKPQYFVADGVCGFGWVTIGRGNHSFCKWLVKNGHARANSYEGGVTVWSPLRTQSMTRNEAFADAFAKVINEIMGSEVRAHSRSRID
jgi:hypothetical protein